MNYKYLIEHPEILAGLKSKETIELECCGCKKKHLRTVKSVKHAIKNKSVENYCSLKCQGISNTKSKIFICENKDCNNSFIKQQSDIKKTNGNFCSRRCAGKHNGKLRELSEETKKKISASLKARNPKAPKIKIVKEPKTSICRNCLMVFIQDLDKNGCKKRRLYCCNECMTKYNKKNNLSVNAGKASAASRQLRSKYEIELFDLIKEVIDSVESNKIIADGWDADIVLAEYKIAICWHGPWHYKEMHIGKVSLKQIQNRDRIKRELFEKLGWEIVEYYDNKFTPKKAFLDFMQRFWL